jgi:branched-chain amino acid aminotransferase
VATTLGQTSRQRSDHPDSWVFYDGAIVRYHDVHIPLMTHALHYGTSCFEGIRAYWNAEKDQLFLLKAAEHYERLRRSAHVLRFTLPYSTTDLVDLTVDILRKNETRADTYVRPLIFGSAEEIGVRLHDLEHKFLIYTAPFGNYIPVDGGIRCLTSTWRRVPDVSIPARAKVGGGYVNSALAKSEALEAGFDEAIMLTQDGHVSEGSAENLFMIKKGVLITPPVTDDILEGITRDLVMDLARDDLGIPVLERSIDRTELYTCDELLLCGTGAQVSPVVELDRRDIGDGTVGPLSQKLQDMYLKAARGDDPRHADWSLPVYPSA